MRYDAPPHALFDRFRSLEPERGGVRAGERLVVAFSGGVDSTALLELLHRLAPEKQLQLVAAHLDHGLRRESADDARWCAQFCAERGIEFVTDRVELANTEAAKQLGIEAAAREARYRFLDRVREARDFDLVATAHHLDDHIETLLLWLRRGAGLTAMEGIRARTLTRLRPLRESTRAEILLYMEARGLSWREDPTNAQGGADRNRIRHELLPRLRAEYGEAGLRCLVDSAQHAARAGRFLGELAEAAREGLELHGTAGRSETPTELAPPDPAIRLDRDGFRTLPGILQLELLRRVVRELEPPGPQRWDRAGLFRLREFALTGKSGKRHPLAGGGWLLLDRSSMAFRGPASPVTEPGTAPELRVELLPGPSDVLTITGPTSALVDADKVNGDLQLRLFQPGDRMQLAGMEGRRKLSDLYREHGVPADRRASMWVVADGEGIVWTVGVAVCGRCRITPGTRRALRLILSTSN